MQNYIGMSKPRPSPAGDGSFVLTNVLAESDPMPLVDVVADTGKWVCAALAEPEAYNGKVMYAAEGMYTYADIAAALGKVTGMTVRYMKVDDQIYKGFMPPGFDEEMLQMNQFLRDFGYYGEGSGDGEGKVDEP
jgi:hypothetical protein